MQLFCRIMCLKNFTKFTGGYLQWRSFFVKLQTWHAGVFLWVLLSFQNSYSKVYLRATGSVLFSVTYALVIISDWLLIKSFKSFIFSKFTFLTLRENCPNTEFFLVRVFLYSVRIQENTDQKILRIWALFVQFKILEISLW